MKKLGIICLPGLTTFIDMIADYFSEICHVTKCYSNSLEEVYHTLMNSDVIWLEWANQMAVQATNIMANSNIGGKQVILRLHSYEALTPQFLQSIRWEVVTDVVFVSSFIQDYVIAQLPAQMSKVRCHVIPNSLDPTKFSVDETKLVT